MGPGFLIEVAQDCPEQEKTNDSADQDAKAQDNGEIFPAVVQPLAQNGTNSGDPGKSEWCRKPKLVTDTENLRSDESSSKMQSDD